MLRFRSLGIKPLRILFPRPLSFHGHPIEPFRPARGGIVARSIFGCNRRDAVQLNGEEITAVMISYTIGTKQEVMKVQKA